MLGQFKYEHAPLDFYPTPVRCTEAMLHAFQNVVRFGALKGWEPACGNGAISRVVSPYCCNFVSTDMVAYDGFDPDGFLDFLRVDKLDWVEDICKFKPELIVTNPPYGALAEEFVKRAIHLTKATRGKVIMIMRSDWDTAKRRMPLFRHGTFRAKAVMTFRPRWIEDTTTGPRFSYAWYLWDWENCGPPSLVYVD
jgi:hypothetical protein